MPKNLEKSIFYTISEACDNGTKIDSLILESICQQDCQKALRGFSKKKRQRHPKNWNSFFDANWKLVTMVTLDSDDVKLA
jgi:hypothetical protein